MRGLVFGVVAMLSCAGTAEAGWLDWMGQGNQPEKIACAPTERACLITAALENRIIAFHDREHDMQISRIGEQIGELAALASPKTRKAIEARLDEITPSTKIKAAYREALGKRLNASGITLEALRNAIATGKTPDGRKMSDYTLAGFRQALRRGEGAAARQLWFDSVRTLWKTSPGALQLMQRDAARHDVDLLRAYHDAFFFSGTRRQVMWRDMSLVAQTHCLNGDMDKGRRVLGLLRDQFSRRAPKDQVIRLYAETEFMAPVLYCQGEDAAMAFLGQLETKMAPAYVYLREKYPGEREQSFVLTAARDTIALRSYEVLARYLLEQNRTDEAKTAFEKGKRSHLVMGFVTGADGKTKPQTTSERTSWEDFQRYFKEDRYRYSLSSKLALTHFLTEFTPDYTRSYPLNQKLETYSEHAEALWPSEISQKAVAMIMQIEREIARRDPKRLAYPDHMMLEIAGWRQPAACRLSESSLAGVIARMADYEFSDQPFMVIIAMLTYQDRIAAAKSDDGLCALAMVAQGDL
ncbi:hypothetical protein N4R57_10715 [Rhodobacteraceae bacterium D3-12]|nr:hypothetical protein N4R57_10715 [Rhodobacteraceae bacterium D3-12]